MQFKRIILARIITSYYYAYFYRLLIKMNRIIKTLFIALNSFVEIANKQKNKTSTRINKL